MNTSVLVVLQALGVEALPQELRSKAEVIYQSVSERPALRIEHGNTIVSRLSRREAILRFVFNQQTQAGPAGFVSSRSRSWSRRS